MFSRPETSSPGVGFREGTHMTMRGLYRAPHVGQKKRDFFAMEVLEMRILWQTGLRLKKEPLTGKLHVLNHQVSPMHHEPFLHH